MRQQGRAGPLAGDVPSSGRRSRGRERPPDTAPGQPLTSPPQGERVFLDVGERSQMVGGLGSSGEDREAGFQE